MISIDDGLWAAVTWLARLDEKLLAEQSMLGMLMLNAPWLRWDEITT
jgi:hypothetical protein